MGKPVILVVDDDEPTLAALVDALQRRFGADYALLSEGSAERAVAVLARMRDDGQPIACVIADQHMPGLTGIDVLLRAHESHRDARRALLLDVFDRSAFQRLAQEMTLGRIDSWLVKPWDPPEQYLYPRVGELLAGWTEATNQGGFLAVRLVTEPWHPRAHEMLDLLHSNGIPTDVMTPDSPQGRTVLLRAGLGPDRLPVVAFFDGRVLANPSNTQVAEALRVATRPPAERYDLVVLGAGPAGLSAAVYAASEGLHTVVVESVELTAGDVLIRQGDPGDRFYAIADGRLQISVDGDPAATKVRGDGIGEIALLRDIPRTATVTAESAATVFGLDRAAFLTAVAGHSHTAQAAAAVADERLDRDRHRQPPTPDDAHPDIDAD